MGRIVQGQPVAWEPNPGAQTRFLASRVSEVLYGGAAGGGKSEASIALLLRWVHNKNFRALFLRRESKYLGDAVDKSSRLYPLLGGNLVQSPRIVWTFPSGAQIWFGHCEHLKDVQNYDSFEFNVVVFEELTHFLERMYRGIRARIRSTDPTLPLFTRSTCNPGGAGHEWVKRRWGAWLDKQAPVKAAPSETLWYLEDQIVAPNTPDALSRTFIPAKLADNPKIPATYRAQLRDLDPVRRAQLMDGDWDVVPAAGLYFKRGWFRIVDAAPVDAEEVRYWDLAASTDGDWTIGVRASLTPAGMVTVKHVVRLRGTPGEVKATVRATAELDGKDCPIVIEQDPAQAGKDQIHTYVTDLAGWNVRGRIKRSDKIVAAGPVSAQAEAGNVQLVRGHWNEPFIATLEAFPDGEHDDDVDALSGAFAVLTSGPDFKVPDPVITLGDATPNYWAV